MTLLTICESLAKNVGLAVPDAIVTSPYRDWSEAKEFANQCGEELSRRVDWGQLTESTTLTGDGTNKVFTLPADFARLPNGVCIINASGEPVRSLSRAEWNTLTPAQGVPRYFLLEGSEVTLFPYLANAATATVWYQSSSWCDGGSAFAADTDEVVFPEPLFLLSLIVRWRRQKGMDYADFEAEYEAALAQYAGFNDRSRL